MFSSKIHGKQEELITNKLVFLFQTSYSFPSLSHFLFTHEKYSRLAKYRNISYLIVIELITDSEIISSTSFSISKSVGLPYFFKNRLTAISFLNEYFAFY
jgi:hypothetical protein